MKYAIGIFSAVLMSLLVTACASPKVGDAPAEEFAGQGLHPVKSSGFETAYVHPGAGLAQYRVINITPMDSSAVEIPQTTVSGTNRRDWQMTPEREQRLAEVWKEATDRTFADYQREGGPALKLTAQLTRVSPGRATGTATTASGATIRGSGDVVDVSVEFRVYNRESDELLAVIRDRRTIASLQWTRAAGADMTNLFNSWAGMLHTRLSGR